MAIVLAGSLLATARGTEGNVPQQTSTTSVAEATTNVMTWQPTRSSESTPALPLRSEFNIWRSLGSLLIVLGCLLAITWYLKRRGGAMGIGGAHRRLQIIEKITVGQRQCLALVRIDDEELLVGISPERITTLELSRKAKGEKASPRSFAATLDEAAKRS